MSFLEPHTQERLQWLARDPYNAPSLCAAHDGPIPQLARWRGCGACLLWDEYLRDQASPDERVVVVVGPREQMTRLPC
jgi:hypothetical protein